MSETPETIALAQKYDAITRQVAQSFKRQLELAKAEQNHEAIIQNEIKLGIMIAARGLFAGTYKSVTNTKPEGNWSET
jgi:hypothetical protein